MSSGTDPTASALDWAPSPSAGKLSPAFCEEEHPCPTSSTAKKSAESDFPKSMMHLLRERISAKKPYESIIKEKRAGDKK
jgi:hypothetical protein